MKKTILCCFLVLPHWLLAQKQIASTDSVLLSGDVAAPGVIRLADAKQYKQISIGDLTLINARNERKGRVKNLRGVRLKDLILAAVRFRVAQPSELSRFYITLVATDGFTALYSWNELFNSPTGDHTFLITAKDGKEMTGQADRILTLTTTDRQTGRRYVKGLQQIVVSRIP